MKNLVSTIAAAALSLAIGSAALAPPVFAASKKAWQQTAKKAALRAAKKASPVIRYGEPVTNAYREFGWEWGAALNREQYGPTSDPGKYPGKKWYE